MLQFKSKSFFATIIIFLCFSAFTLDAWAQIAPADDPTLNCNNTLDQWNGEGTLESRKNDSLNRGPVDGTGALDPARNLAISWNEHEVFIHHYQKDAQGQVVFNLVGRILHEGYAKSGIFVDQAWDGRKMVVFFTWDKTTRDITLRGLDITDPANPHWEVLNHNIPTPSSNTPAWWGDMALSSRYLCAALAEGGVVCFDRAAGYPVRAVLHDSSSSAAHWRIHYRLQILEENGRAILAGNGYEKVHFYDVTDLPQGSSSQNFEISAAYLGSAVFPTQSSQYNFPNGITPNADKFTDGFTFGRMPGTTYTKNNGQIVERILLTLGMRPGLLFADLTAMIEDGVQLPNPLNPVGDFWLNSSIAFSASTLTMKNGFLISGWAWGGPAMIRLIALDTNYNLSTFRARQVYTSRIKEFDNPTAAGSPNEIFKPLMEDPDDGLYITPARVTWAMAAWSTEVFQQDRASCITDLESSIQTNNQLLGRSDVDLRFLSWNLNAWQSSYVPPCRFDVVGKAGGPEYGDWLEGAAFVPEHKVAVVADWANGYRLYDFSNPENPMELQSWRYIDDHPIGSTGPDATHKAGLYPYDVEVVGDKIYGSHANYGNLGMVVLRYNPQMRRASQVADIRDVPAPTDNRKYDHLRRLAVYHDTANNKHYVLALRINYITKQHYLSVIDTETDQYVSSWIPPQPAAGKIIINDLIQSGEHLYFSFSEIDATNKETLKLMVVKPLMTDSNISFAVQNTVTVSAAPANYVAPGEGRTITSNARDGAPARFLYLSSFAHGGYLYDVQGGFATSPRAIQFFPMLPHDAFWSAHPVTNGPQAGGVLLGDRLVVDSIPRTVWKINSNAQGVSFLGYHQNSGFFRGVTRGDDFVLTAGLYGGTHVYPLCAASDSVINCSDDVLAPAMQAKSLSYEEQIWQERQHFETHVVGKLGNTLSFPDYSSAQGWAVYHTLSDLYSLSWAIDATGDESHRSAYAVLGKKFLDITVPMIATGAGTTSGQFLYLDEAHGTGGAGMVMNAIYENTKLRGLYQNDLVSWTQQLKPVLDRNILRTKSQAEGGYLNCSSPHMSAKIAPGYLAVGKILGNQAYIDAFTNIVEEISACMDQNTQGWPGANLPFPQVDIMHALISAVVQHLGYREAQRENIPAKITEAQLAKLGEAYFLQPLSTYNNVVLTEDPMAMALLARFAAPMAAEAESIYTFSEIPGSHPYTRKFETVAGFMMGFGTQLESDCATDETPADDVSADTEAPDTQGPAPDITISPAPAIDVGDLDADSSTGEDSDTLPDSGDSADSSSSGAAGDCPFINPADCDRPGMGNGIMPEFCRRRLEELFCW